MELKGQLVVNMWGIEQGDYMTWGKKIYIYCGAVRIMRCKRPRYMVVILLGTDIGTACVTYAHMCLQGLPGGPQGWFGVFAYSPRLNPSE